MYLGFFLSRFPSHDRYLLGPASARTCLKELIEIAFLQNSCFIEKWLNIVLELKLKPLIKSTQHQHFCQQQNTLNTPLHPEIYPIRNLIIHQHKSRSKIVQHCPHLNLLGLYCNPISDLGVLSIYHLSQY